MQEGNTPSSRSLTLLRSSTSIKQSLYVLTQIRYIEAQWHIDTGSVM